MMSLAKERLDGMIFLKYSFKKETFEEKFTASLFKKRGAFTFSSRISEYSCFSFLNPRVQIRKHPIGKISLGEEGSWFKGGGSSASVWSLSYRASICHPAIRPSYPSLAGGVVQPGICKNTQRKWSLWARQE